MRCFSREVDSEVEDLQPDQTEPCKQHHHHVELLREIPIREIRVREIRLVGRLRRSDVFTLGNRVGRERLSETGIPEAVLDVPNLRTGRGIGV